MSARHGGARALAWAALVLVLGFVVARFPGPLHTLEPGYTDHARHERTAWTALSEGPRIWTEPLSSWGDEEDAAHGAWPTIAHPYPPGSVLLFLPVGAAVGLGVVPDETGHVLLVVLFAIGAAAAVVLLRAALHGRWPPALAWVAVVLAGVDLLRWSLDGFFDAVAVAVALAGVGLVRRGRSGPALAVLAAALSLHLRLWYLLPVVAAAAVRHRRVDRWSVVAVVVLGVSALTALLLLPSFAALPDAAEFQPNPLRGSPAAWVLAVGCTAVVAVAERRAGPSDDDVGWPVAAATTGLALALLLANPQWQAWYPLALVPALPVLRAPGSQAAILLAYVQLTLVVPGAAGALVLLRHLGAALGGRG